MYEPECHYAPWEYWRHLLFNLALRVRPAQMQGNRGERFCSNGRKNWMCMEESTAMNADVERSLRARYASTHPTWFAPVPYFGGTALKYIGPDGLTPQQKAEQERIRCLTVVAATVDSNVSGIDLRLDKYYPVI
jgi:hypothetical protein